MTYSFLIFIGIITLYFIFRKKFFSHKKINKIKNFKNKFTKTEAKIEKIFFRNNERLIRDPNINLIIGLHEKESELIQKTSIHRARLAKFNKSKLNGEFIYKDFKGNLYKIVNKNKVYF